MMRMISSTKPKEVKHYDNDSSHFFDGRDIEAEWKNKRTMPPRSEERKAEMSRKMKEIWRKRRGESNDNSGNNQPVYSNTD